jgi:hypothetical protein
VDFELLEPADLAPTLRRFAARLRRATQRSGRSPAPAAKVQDSP